MSSAEIGQLSKEASACSRLSDIGWYFIVLTFHDSDALGDAPWAVVKRKIGGLEGDGNDYKTIEHSIMLRSTATRFLDICCHRHLLIQCIPGPGKTKAQEFLSSFICFFFCHYLFDRLPLELTFDFRLFF